MPPPSDAVMGNEHLTWLQLNAWELAHLRKRMKKNLIWNPSYTMIARELHVLGRGVEHIEQQRRRLKLQGNHSTNRSHPNLEERALKVLSVSVHCGWGTLRSAITL